MPAVGRRLREMMPVTWFSEGWIILGAAALDWAIGDPWGWPHPVQAMGRVISLGSNWVLKRSCSPGVERGMGVLLGLLLVLGSGLTGWGLIYGAQTVHPLLGFATESVLLASCLAGRSLRRAAEDVLYPLESGDIVTARQRLSFYVGRDTETLEPPEIRRAVMETISENATDGVMAPLFYALVGALILPVGSVPFALAYKAASTLDSMVGYREMPYRYLGWFSARLEDGLTWLPCRLTVLTIALLSGRRAEVYRLCRRDAPADPSPNAGWSECAYAAALGVQLGGTNSYRGQVKIKPKLGDPLHPISAATIRQGLNLTRRAVLLWLSVGVLASGLIAWAG